MIDGVLDHKDDSSQIILPLSTFSVPDLKPKQAEESGEGLSSDSALLAFLPRVGPFATVFPSFLMMVCSLARRSSSSLKSSHVSQ